MTTLVTLTTDFGARDPYVASMKGVLFQACPSIQVIDLSHDISPQNVLEGSLFWAGAIPYFPPGGIHVGVIDPSVGTARLPIVVQAQGHRFVCPDNGLLTLFLRDHPMDEARVISNPQFMREKVSATFHGRDVFAPAAAKLAQGVPVCEVGDRLGNVVTLDVPEPRVDASGICGQVIHIDRFGNAITNIPRALLGGKHPREVRFADLTVRGVHNTYADVAPEAAVALFGSAEYLEVAVNGGNASIALGLEWGDEVRVVF